ncbi:cytoskeletal protein CcmA (bactofilin family) [Natranaerovirga hydrolytica]|uniref:Cytoskeletal protein CcmA (Bactofilin family) n=1 Tax=Natranaerovirga hydrolytica TaxID=680378 RepID=A0A4V2PZA1_9FIRM|nr:polymer-forming cytoskeletal protein [Natranaerovirga hydrolytica]TCK89041.1 cytoskeletal protein CcmA (bactofilin family) [Natranaerovirga hydrolytica]
MKKNKGNFEKFNTIIGNDAHIEGSMIKSKSSIQINGTYIGNVEVEDSLVIGEEGKVEGQIKASHLLVAGTIKGNVESNVQIHIMPTGKIYGDIHCKSIVIDDGAILEGMCKMKTDQGPLNNKKETSK